MTPDWGAFIFGLIGLVGYEAFRLHHEYNLPRIKLPFVKYIKDGGWIVIPMAIFTGSLAMGVASHNLIEALYIGFSGPASVRFVTKGIIKGSDSAEMNDGVIVEDFHLGNRKGLLPTIVYRIKKYFF